MPINKPPHPYWDIGLESIRRPYIEIHEGGWVLISVGVSTLLIVGKFLLGL